MKFLKYNLNKKIFVFLFILIFCFGALWTPQARAEGAYDAVSGTATCSVGQILGRLVSSAVGSAIGGLTNKVTGSIASSIENMATKVPVADSVTQGNTQADAENTARLRMKTVGGGNSGGGILSGILSSVSDVSLDSIMFCIVNEVLTYITNSTINWINNGFQGSPVFVQNPERMLQTIADREMGNFTYSLSNGVKSIAGSATNQIANGAKRAIIGIAEPIRSQVTQNIIGSYNSGFEDSIRPSLNALSNANYNSCINGNWNACGGFNGFAELARPENNVYGATHIAQIELNRRIAEQQQLQKEELARNNGFKSFKTCQQGYTRGYDGTCNPANSTVTTPGYLVGQELQSRGLMKYMRVAVAKDFDSIVTALVNQLVKIAVNKVYEEAGKATQSLNEAF